MNIHYFRINIGQEWQYIFPKQQIVETTTPHQNLGDGKYVKVEREKYLNVLNQECYSSENLFTYDFYNQYGETFVCKNGWKLEQIEEYEQDGKNFIVYLHIVDPLNIFRKIEFYIQDYHWKSYQNRFLYLTCASTNFLLYLVKNKPTSWSDSGVLETIKGTTKMRGARLHLINESLFIDFLDNGMK